MKNSTNRYPAIAPEWDTRNPARPQRLFRPANQNRPYVPGRHPYPGIKFGKRIPKPGEVGPARLPKLPGWKPYYKYGFRLVPAVSLGLTAWEIAEWLNDVPSRMPAISPADYGFGLCCMPGPPDGTKYRYTFASRPCESMDIFCGLDLQVPSGSPIGEPCPPGRTQLMFRGRPQVGGLRMIYDEYWSRTAPENVTLPEINPADFRPPQPSFIPNPEPLPEPYRVPVRHPFRPPGVTPERVPRPWPRRLPRAPTLPEDRVSHEPENWDRPGTRPLPRPRPVRKKEKEPPKRKATPDKVARLRTALGKIVGGASEVAEAIEALYESLPDERQSKNDKTLADKVDKIFKYGDEIDVTKFMEKMIENQKEDSVWGHGWQAIADTFDIGSPTGIKL